MAQTLRRRVLFSLAFAALVVFGLTLYANLPDLLTSFSHFRWEFVPLILAFTLLNYGLRSIKFRYLLRQVGGGGISPLRATVVYVAGLSMVMTPGKVGEWVKSYLLSIEGDMPVSRSAPIIVVERLTDALAMIVISAAGLLLFHVGWQFVLAAAVLVLAVIFVARDRPLALWTLDRLARMPVVGGKVGFLRALYDSTEALFRPRHLLIAGLISLVSWTGECVGLFLVLVGLGQPASGVLLLQAGFMLSSSLLAGAVLLVPGGLGVAEGGITGLAQLLVGMSASDAVAATLIIRACTIWFGVAIGTVALLTFTGRARSEAGLTAIRGEQPGVHHA